LDGGTAYENYKAPATGTYFACASIVSNDADYDLSVQPYERLRAALGVSTGPTWAAPSHSPARPSRLAVSALLV
jgi:hypothetical protein